MADPASMETTEGRRGLAVPRAAAALDPSASGDSLPPLEMRVEIPVPVSVGDYDILEVLGRGGMGVVYKGRHRTIGRLAAIKMILSAGHVGPVEIARFCAEAEAVGRLQHPNIVQIHEVDEADGNPYFALEFVEGGTLSDRIGERALSGRQAAQLIEPLARAIHVAHKSGIVHRDLKPGNILLTIDGVPKIADFGLAKRTDTDAATTGTGRVLGTPAYMAPEQAEGKNRELGPGVDIYALGSVLYHLLTGRPPFVGETVLDTLQQVKYDDPLPPRRLQRRIPRDLEIICLKCLQKEPRKRYVSAEELADDLARFLRDEPIRARSTGAFERARKWIRRQPALAALWGTLFLVVVGGFFVVFRLWMRAESKHNWALEEIRESQERELRDQTRLKEAADALHAYRMKLAQQAVRDGDQPELRALLGASTEQADGFEWRYLDRLSLLPKLDAAAMQGRVLTTKTPVVAVVFGADSSALGAADDEGRLTLWNLESGEPVEEIAIPVGVVQSIAFDPAKSVWAVASDNGSTTLHRAGEKVDLVSRHPIPKATALAFGPDRRLVTGTADGRVDLGRDDGSAPIAAHTAEVRCLAFRDGSKQFASGGGDRIVRLWKGDQLSSLKLEHEAPVRALAYDPKLPILASASIGGTIRLWDPDTGKATLTMHAGPAGVTALAFDPTGRRLVSGDAAGALKIWDPATGRELLSLAGHSRGITSIGFGPDGRRMASTGLDRTIRVWDAK